jgi:hypothetical protein
MMRR